MTAPTPAQAKAMRRALTQPSYKFPRFDENGRHVDQRVIDNCIKNGWVKAENKHHPEVFWVYRLTPTGRAVANGRKE